MVKKKKLLSEGIVPYLFLLPWIIGFVFLVAYPLIETIYLSFFNVTNNIDGRQLEYIGFKNFYDAINVNATFKTLLFEFVIMEITYVPAVIILSLILAILLNSSIRGKSFFRLIYFFPVVIMSGPVMKQLESSNSLSIMNTSNILIFKMVDNFSPALASVITGILNNFTTILWFTGIPIVLFLNGLQRINSQMFEAAEIDGANKWQTLWKISVPNLKSTILLVAIFVVIQIAIFELNPIYMFVVNDQITKNRLVKLGFASSVVLIYSVVILAIVAITFLIFKEKSEQKIIKTLEQRQKNELMKIKKRSKELKKRGVVK